MLTLLSCILLYSIIVCVKAVDVACNFDAIKTAIQSGGEIDLKCSEGQTVVVSSTFSISGTSTIINGNGVIFDGQSLRPIFKIERSSGSFPNPNNDWQMFFVVC
jgi:hypothetical protein